MELKPCPFCGGSATFATHERSTEHSYNWVRCRVCHCRTAALPGANCITVWNTRRSPLSQETVDKAKERYGDYLMERDARRYEAASLMAVRAMDSLGALLDELEKQP